MAGTGSFRPALITDLAQLGFIDDTQFEAPIDVYDETKTALNLQKISNAMFNSVFNKNDLEIYLDMAKYPNLFASIRAGVFANRAGISGNLTLKMSSREKPNQEVHMVVSQAMSQLSKESGENAISLWLTGIDSTTPRITFSDNTMHYVIPTAFYTPEMDAANGSKTFEEIMQELHTKRENLPKAGNVGMSATSTTFANLWAKTKTKLGLSAIDNSELLFTFIWYRNEGLSNPTTIYITRMDSNEKREFQAVQTTTGFSCIEVTPKSASGVKVYEFTTTATHSLAGNANVVVGRMTGQTGILSTNALLKTFKNVGVTTGATTADGVGAVFSESGNPVVTGYVANGLFKMNNSVYNNLNFEIRVTLPNANIVPFLQKWNGTTWVNLKSFAIRSTLPAGEYTGDASSYSTGQTDDFNINTFRVVLFNTIATAATIPAQTIRLTIKGV